MNKYSYFRHNLKKNKTISPVILLMTLGLLLLVPLSVQARQEIWSVQRHDLTNFPLTGRHRTVACGECHLKGLMGGTPTQCEDCHWSRKNDDPYKLKLGINCEDCHSSTDWNKINPGAWDHLQETGFQLSGQHRIQGCLDCHKNSNFSSLDQDCFACHERDYFKVDEPDHQLAGFSEDCILCHGDSASTWDGASVNHNQYWTLKGIHNNLDCISCHTDGYANTVSDCIACHQADFNATTNPNHPQAGYSTDCLSCHSDSASTWEGASFDHNQYWALKGTHIGLDCLQCHADGYAGTVSNCIACHQSDFDNTTNPNHPQAGYSTDCIPCHGDSASTWEGASFDHNQYWTLQGAHTSLDCNQCHADGYAGTLSDCNECHASDYDNSIDPNHQSAGFPRDCAQCHFGDHFSWSQGIFLHIFPLTSGDHKNLSCVECHTTSNYKDFTCIDCHEHTKSEVDNEHKDVSGYSYSTLACYSCHPQGRE